MIFILILILLISILWLWSLIHCIINKRISDTNRIVGIICIVVLGIIGSVIYLCLPRREARRSGTGTYGARNVAGRGTTRTVASVTPLRRSRAR